MIPGAVLLCGSFGLRGSVSFQETMETLRNHARYQRRMFDQAVQLVRPGGVLVYSTWVNICRLFPASFHLWRCSCARDYAILRPCRLRACPRFLAASGLGCRLDLTWAECFMRTEIFFFNFLKIHGGWLFFFAMSLINMLILLDCHTMWFGLC